MPKTTPSLPNSVTDKIEQLVNWLMAHQHERCVDMFYTFLEEPVIKKALFNEKNQLLYNTISLTLFKKADEIIDQQIEDPNLDNFKQHIKAHLLGLLPFFEPEQGDIFTSTHLGTFKVQSVDSITPRIFGAPYDLYHVIEQTQSGTQASVSSNILFMGTNPIPTASGSFWTRFADLIPGLPIGFMLDRLGSNTVAKHVEEADKNSRPINFIGQSLGGILSIMAGERHASAHVYAIAPPFLLNQTYTLTYFALLSFAATTLILILGGIMPPVVFGYPSIVATLLSAGAVSLFLTVILKILIKPTQPVIATVHAKNRVIYSHQSDVVHWLGLRQPDDYTMYEIPLGPLTEIKKNFGAASFIDALCLSLIVAAINVSIMPLSTFTIVIVLSAFLTGLLARKIAQTVKSSWSHMLNRHACRGDFHPQENKIITLKAFKSRALIIALFHTLIALPAMLILTPYLLIIKPIQTFLAWIHLPKCMIAPMTFMPLFALCAFIPPISAFITVQINQALHAQGVIHVIGMCAQNIGTVLTLMIVLTTLSISLWAAFKCLGKVLSLYQHALSPLTPTILTQQKPPVKNPSPPKSAAVSSSPHSGISSTRGSAFHSGAAR